MTDEQKERASSGRKGVDPYIVTCIRKWLVDCREKAIKFETGDSCKVSGINYLLSLIDKQPSEEERKPIVVSTLHLRQKTKKELRLMKKLTRLEREMEAIRKASALRRDDGLYRRGSFGG
uniref:Uncharacterized protein n=1 Tax=viral metagenome TaxID=1070528 RepID=A0A6M3K796_9ZZZZ